MDEQMQAMMAEMVEQTCSTTEALAESGRMARAAAKMANTFYYELVDEYDFAPTAALTLTAAYVQAFKVS